MKRDRRGRYRNNRISKLLRSDSGAPWSGWVEFVASDWVGAALLQVPGRTRGGPDPVVAAHGVDFFTYLAAHPDAAQAFHESQAAGVRLQAVLVADVIDTAEVTSVCDVGGSTGTLVTQLLSRKPDLRGCVLDLPEARAGAEATFASAALGDRAEFVEGDFFASVPAGHDLYLLTAIVHDWSDADAVRILRNCASAMAPNARIVVVEQPLRRGQRGNFAQTADFLMLSVTGGGRERTHEELTQLFTKAGLRCARDTTMPSLFHAYELVPASER